VAPLQPPPAWARTRRPRAMALLALLLLLVATMVRGGHLCSPGSSWPPPRNVTPYVLPDLSNATHLRFMSMSDYACEIPSGADYPDRPPWTNASWMNLGRTFELAAMASGHQIMGFPVLWRLDNYGVPLPNNSNYAQGIMCMRDGVSRACSRAAGDPSDMAAAWKQSWQVVKPFILNGTCNGIFVGDEVTSHGMPFDEFEMIVDTVAADLFSLRAEGPHNSSLYLMCNEDGHAAGWRGRKPNRNPKVPLPWPRIPFNLTHFSMDWYHDPTRRCRTDADCNVPGVGSIGWCIAATRCSNVRDLYEQMYAVAADHHRFLVYPPAYGSKTNGLQDHGEGLQLANLTFYVNWAREDTRVVGFSPYQYGNGIVPYDLGASSLPTLWKALVALGRHIIGSRQPTYSVKIDGGHTRNSVSARVTSEQDLFSSKDTSIYTCFRTMSIVQTDLSLHVFVEARRGNCIDQPSGGTDVLTRRSTDRGRSFSVARRLVGDGKGSSCVYRNPYATYDKLTRRLILNFVNTTNCSRTDRCFSRWNSKQMHSDTDGDTWTAPTDVNWNISVNSTSSLRAEGCLMGPGHGIQLNHQQSNPSQQGWLLMCGSSTFQGNQAKPGSIVSISRDGGNRWQPTALILSANECSIVETSDGTLVFNGRGRFGHMAELGTPRIQAISTSGGLTWSSPKPIAGIKGPGAAGGLAFTRANSLGILWMSNPDTADQNFRANISLSTSLDDGQNWVDVLRVYTGPSSYSVLSPLTNDSDTTKSVTELGLLFERCNASEADPGPAPWHQCWWGRKRSSERVSFAVIETAATVPSSVNPS
jgi:hypothetical protein